MFREKNQAESSSRIFLTLKFLSAVAYAYEHTVAAYATAVRCQSPAPTPQHYHLCTPLPTYDIPVPGMPFPVCLILIPRELRYTTNRERTFAPRRPLPPRSPPARRRTSSDLLPFAAPCPPSPRAPGPRFASRGKFPAG